MDATNDVTPLGDDSVLSGQGPARMHDFLEAKVRAKAARPLPLTREALDKERPAQQKELMRCLGLDPLPPRTALNARVTRTIQRAGYRVENIVFDSRPDFPVTAQLYVPDHAEGHKLPVIVNAIGHWQHKKAEPVVQARMIFEALHGYLGLVVDSPGFSFEGNARVERRPAGTHHDLKLIESSTSATSVYVWDLMRAVDYLGTRPDADMSRIGLTGASGGGLATLYGFAAESRFACAVPVVYASSLEVNPDNGCECNHVPGTLQVGDRADVLGLRAPAPVYIIGAELDGEFPKAGMLLTGKKLSSIWGLYGAQADSGCEIFPGGHDYNQAMQERMIGFFDLHLRGVGDGTPVRRPPLETAAVDSREMFCQPDPAPGGQQTMRGIARATLSRAAHGVSFAETVRINGGLPEPTDLNYREMETSGDVRHVTFESEAGLTIPGILYLPASTKPSAVLIVASESGKSAAAADFQVASIVKQGVACLAIDVRGIGELSGLDPRLLAYLGTGAPFAMGWDITRAAQAMHRYSTRVGVVARGAATAQAALFAGLLDPQIVFVAGLDGLRDYSDVFADEVPILAIQPRANYCTPLSDLRSNLGQRTITVWSFRGEATPPDWQGAFARWLDSAQ